jgi:hypothetical protein
MYAKSVVGQNSENQMVAEVKERPEIKDGHNNATLDSVLMIIDQSRRRNL